MTAPDDNRDGSNSAGSEPGAGESIEHPHDSFFRQLMSKPFAATEMLRGWLPASLADELDWPTLQPGPADYVDVDLRQTHGDCLFLVRPFGAADDSPPSTPKPQADPAQANHSRSISAKYEYSVPG